MRLWVLGLVHDGFLVSLSVLPLSTQGPSVTQGHSETPLPSSFRVPRQLRAHKRVNPNDQRLLSNPSGKVTRESPAYSLRAGLGRAGTGITVHRARCHGSARHTTAANRVSRHQGRRGCVSGQTAVARLWSAVALCKVTRPALARLLRLLQGPPSLGLPRPPNPAWPILAQFGLSHVHSAISIIFIRLRATVHALLPPQTLLLQLAFHFCPLRQDPSAIVPPPCRRSLLGTKPVPLSVVGSLLARSRLAHSQHPCWPGAPWLSLSSRPSPCCGWIQAILHLLLFFPGSPALSRPGSIIISPVFPLQYASFLPCPFSLTETRQHPHALTTSSPVSPRTRWSFYPSSLTPR